MGIYCFVRLSNKVKVYTISRKWENLAHPFDGIIFPEAYKTDILYLRMSFPTRFLKTGCRSVSQGHLLHLDIWGLADLIIMKHLIQLHTILIFHQFEVKIYILHTKAIFLCNFVRSIILELSLLLCRSWLLIWLACEICIPFPGLVTTAKLENPCSFHIKSNYFTLCHGINLGRANITQSVCTRSERIKI